MTVGWLGLGCDLSMVASAFNLDPLARTTMTRGFTLVNKTGTAAGVRADVGFVERSRGLCDLCGDRQLGRARNARRT